MANYSITVIGLKTLPYDSSSKIAKEYPGESLFDTRNDYILLKNTSHLAILATLCNNNFLGDTERGARAKLTFTLSDPSENDKILSSKTETVAISKEHSMLQHRTDIALNSDTVKTGHTYMVTVYNKKEPIYRRHIRFFNLYKIRRLHTGWFNVLSGSLKLSYECKHDTLMSPGAFDNNVVEIQFTLNSNISKHFPLPEMYITVVAPDCTKKQIAKLQPCSEDGIKPFDLDYKDENDENNKMSVFCSKTLSAKASFPLNTRTDGNGLYEVYLELFGRPIASFIFLTEGDAIPGEWTGDDLKYNSCETYNRKVERLKKRFDKLLDSKKDLDAGIGDNGMPINDFDLMIGLENVKARIDSMIEVANFNRLRKKAGLNNVKTSLHSMFLGSPGTGKTTVAKIIGKKLHDNGILSKGHVVVRERSNLVGKYYGDESKFVLDALEEADGGILFIDEAYQLYQKNDPKDPGRLVIETLLSALADESKRDWMLILAGYTKPMMELFNLNTGLKSRIPEANTILFPDYSSEQLMQIAEFRLKNSGFILSPDARTALAETIENDWRNHDETFGNARHIANLIETGIIPAMAKRIAKIAEPTIEQLSEIIVSDIPEPTMHKSKCARRPVGFAG